MQLCECGVFDSAKIFLPLLMVQVLSALLPLI
jgi:hypothetical protein